MLTLSHVTKRYATRHGIKTVLDDIAFTVSPGEKVGILGQNGVGKSTLIKLISGAEKPTSGTIKRGMSVSWPLAFSGGFQGSLTGYDNLRFICRVYGAQYEPLVPFIEDFTELGHYLREPVKTYSTGMTSRLAFGISMAIEFDCYLIDEVIAAGDARFVERCQIELFEKRKDRALIIVSHQASNIKMYCDTAYVLHQGKLEKFSEIDNAYTNYNNKLQVK